MFSGIKYIFGYTDETVSSSVSDATASTVPQQTTTVSGAPDAAPTTKLEQTLNAATTKFTEQLLPQQASIEQLQSSSHQLLPSIIEQHEEDELKKKSSLPLGDEIDAACDADDEDGFNVESWELLDLVEKAEDALAPASLISSVQKDETPSRGSSSKSTSGILKNTSDTNDNGTPQVPRQKAKVSFEESDLVILKEIEQVVQATEVKPGPSKAGGEAVVEKKKKKRGASNGANCEKVPILNYAKALTSKPSNKTQAVEKKASVVAEHVNPLPSSSKTADGGNGANLNGPVKRNRPARVSTSSWSSHDDEDDIEKVHKVDWDEAPGKQSTDEACANAREADLDGVDNESMVSSGFSDCDYGFGGINDYVMRPKKANVRRTRTVSGSLGPKSARPEKKLAIVKAKLASAIEAKSESTSNSSSAKESSSSRNSKPKKKRMIMSTSRSVNLSDFLKHKPSASNEIDSQQAARRKTNASDAPKRQTSKQRQAGGNACSTESSDVADMDESWFVTPPSCFTAKRDNVADRVDPPRTKEADRENALIENPSVYIANAASKGASKNASAKPSSVSKVSSAAKAQPTRNLKTTPSLVAESLITFDDSWNSGEESDEADDKLGEARDRSAGVHKLLEAKERKLQSAVMAHQQQLVEQKQHSASQVSPAAVATSTTKAVTKIVNKKSPKSSPAAKAKASLSLNHAVGKPAESKAWKNKFIVDAWDVDENDDSDFDNMFESNKKRKSSNKSNKKQQHKQAKVKKTNTAEFYQELANFEQEANSSVELISVKSLVSQEFEDGENLVPLSSSSSVSSLVEIGKRSILGEFIKQVPLITACKGNTASRRPPTQVRPIEPERVPGWQLKRQRSKRRPLATMASSAVANKQPQQQTLTGSPKTSKAKDELPSSASSSSRSTPTLIDRIGCSIVTNLTNLTNGLVSSGAMNCCPPSGKSTIMESQERAIGNKSNLAHRAAAHVARKQLSRGSIKRQNICAKQGNSLRRPDRRLKLASTPNGCSVNRKVHTSIH